MTTPERILIQQELIERPRATHRAIAEGLGVATNVVGMLCSELNKGKCEHGKTAKKKPGAEVNSKSENERTRGISIHISDKDWNAFKKLYDKPGRRLGELVKKDIGRG